MAQTQLNNGVNVGRDEIDRQINMGDDSTYIENQINQYGDKKIPHALTKHPFISEIFIGREDDLKAIDRKSVV